LATPAQKHIIPRTRHSHNPPTVNFRKALWLTRFYHRPPDQITDDELKAYLLHLLRVKKLAVGSLIVAVSGLRFFFGQVLHRPTAAIEQALPRMITRKT
jgi:hypothetical protein